MKEILQTKSLSLID